MSRVSTVLLLIQYVIYIIGRRLLIEDRCQVLARIYFKVLKSYNWSVSSVKESLDRVFTGESAASNYLVGLLSLKQVISFSTARLSWQRSTR
jgi:hypothetical protein